MELALENGCYNGGSDRALKERMAWRHAYCSDVDDEKKIQSPRNDWFQHHKFWRKQCSCRVSKSQRSDQERYWINSNWFSCNSDGVDCWGFIHWRLAHWSFRSRGGKRGKETCEKERTRGKLKVWDWRPQRRTIIISRRSAKEKRKKARRL